MIDRPRKNATAFVETKIGDEIIVMHLESGEFFSLRGTAGEIWQLIGEVETTEEIAEVLAERHNAPAEAVQNDVAEFLDQLAQADFLGPE